MTTDAETEHPILLFDGVCNLCNGYVKFVLERDTHERFRFGSLQSDVADELLDRCDLPADYNDSLVLIEGSNCFTESSAVVRMGRHFDGTFGLLGALGVVPKPIRDIVYRFVADHRYEWFGKQDRCMAPDPNVESRFIDAVAEESET